MSYKFLFVLNALLALVFGAAFLAVPGQSLGFFQAEQYAATLLMGRFFGSAMIALGLVLWFVKDANDDGVQKMVAISLLISSVLGLVVNIMGIVGGVVRTNGWITIIVYVLFALGYAFMLFLKPKMKEE
ncbi:MAG TPA: hypothetical protein VJ972_10030 [Anaerolineales bacterium]|nr:hypothetical protein [Anaerolineales bacterium]